MQRLLSRLTVAHTRLPSQQSLKMDQALDKHIATLEGTAAPADQSNALQALTQGEAVPGPEDTGKGLLAVSTHRPLLHKPYNMVGRLGPCFWTLAFVTCRSLISPHSAEFARLEYAIRTLNWLLPLPCLLLLPAHPNLNESSSR